MEGNSSHGFLQEDVSYDDLMNSAAWSMPNDQYSYQQPHPAQASYAPPYTDQPSFDHYDLQQHSHPEVAYTNSPYANPPQYHQHARPSDVFGPPSYNLDPALQSLPAYPAESSFSFGMHGTENHHTIAPQSLQYQMSSAAQPSINRAVSNTAFQRPPTNFSRQPQDPSALYFNHTQNGHLQNTENPIQYPSLPSGSSEPEAKPVIKKLAPDDSPGVPTTPAPRVQQVKVEPPQNTLRVTHPEIQAAKNPSCRPRFPYAPFLSWEDIPIQVAPGLKNTLPKYHPRKSRSGKELIPGLDLSRAAAPARPLTKKVKVLKETKLSLNRYKGTSKGPRLLNDKLASLRGDESAAAVKLPSTPTETETSSSEEELSSEEESEYEEDEVIPVMDISEIRSVTRPTDVSDAAGWDAVGIIWKDPNSNPSAEVVKGAIIEYGDFVSALRIQLKTNSMQAEEAASSPAEVDRLKGNRRVLLESLYQTIRAANTLGYPAIVENLGSHQKLVNGLTTTLIECIKAEDFLGKLPKAVFSLLAKFQNMSDVLLKKLKFDSITKRWNKKGDDEIKKNIASILSHTAEAKERASKVQKEARQAEDSKKVGEKIDQSKQRSVEPLKAVSNPAKRPHDGEGAISKPNKKFASDVAGTPASSKPAPPKRPTNILANNLLGISSKPAAKPAPKKREPSPPTESKLGALLAQIAEPVKPPKAPEPKPLPPETPEEKKRRERKESRRHLRVKFKEGPDLEEIRLFKHEQAEDEGRQDGMLKDAHDDRSEGMMHKKRVSETMEAMEIDDDDYNPEDINFEEHPYPNLVSIDFSDLDKATMFGPTYATRGGEKAVASPEQQIQQRREALELMVVYTDPKDVPPTPKEPPQGDTSAIQQERQLKGPIEPWLVQRLQAQLYGPEYASQLLQHQKLVSAQDNQGHGFGQPVPTSSSTNINTALQQLDGSTHQLSTQQDSIHPTNTSQNPVAAMSASDWENIQRIVKQLKGKPYPSIEPPDWMTIPAQRADWWEGYNRDKAAKEKTSANAQATQLQAQFQSPTMPPPQTHQPTMTPIVNPFPPPPPPNMLPQGPDMAQQVQSYLTGLQVSGNGKAPSQQQFDHNGWSSSHEEQDDYADNDQQQRWDGDRENENSRSRGNKSQNKSNSNSGGGKNRGYEMKQWSGGNGKDPLFDENGEYKGKKKPCTFWAQGKCAKGAKCTWLHD